MRRPGKGGASFSVRYRLFVLAWQRACRRGAWIRSMICNHRRHRARSASLRARPHLNSTLARTQHPSTHATSPCPPTSACQFPPPPPRLASPVRGRLLRGLVRRTLADPRADRAEPNANAARTLLVAPKHLARWCGLPSARAHHERRPAGQMPARASGLGGTAATTTSLAVAPLRHQLVDSRGGGREVVGVRGW